MFAEGGMFERLHDHGAVGGGGHLTIDSGDNSNDKVKRK